MARLGCGTILYGGHPLEAALDGIRRAGFDAIELAAIPGMAEHLSVHASDAAIRSIRAAAADRALSIESIGASTDVLDAAKRDRFRHLIHLAAALGAPAITTGSGGVSDDPDSWRAMVAIWRDLAVTAAAVGIRLSVKPHVRAAVYSTLTAERFIAEVDSSDVGLNIDGSHLWRVNEDPVAAIRRLAPHVATARIRDAGPRDAAGPGAIEQQIPGGGLMDVAAIAAEFARTRAPYLVLEIVGTRDFSLAAVQDVVERSHAALRAMTGEAA
ncbi:MAG: sugar phosphate isomerase/epimerase [Chloroflexota bacterium]|nr:MAG: sugar phosphate isomerase/epimerase [Chloroflexota bacterium]